MIAFVGGVVAEAEAAAGLSTLQTTVDETVRRLTTPELSHRICDYAARVGGNKTITLARDLLLRATAARQNPAGAAHLLLFDARLALRRGEHGHPVLVREVQRHGIATVPGGSLPGLLPSSQR